MDSGCMQSIIHLNLVQPGALVEASSVDIRCVHGDFHSYPVVPVEIRLGLGFNELVGQYVGVDLRRVGTQDMCAVLSGDGRLSDAADGEEELAVPLLEVPQEAPQIHFMEDFPLEQTRDDTLCFAFGQVIDGHVVCPDATQDYPHFTLIRDRLYRVSRKTQTGKEMTQLLVQCGSL